MKTIESIRPWPLVIGAGAILGLSLGARHVQGLFLMPVTLDRGWTRDIFASAIAWQNLVWGLTQPFCGLAADRFGSTRVAASGLALYAVGLATMACATSQAVFFAGASVLIGIALSCTAFAVVFGAVGRLSTPDHRSWALGTAGALAGLWQFMLVPSVQHVIGRAGWSTALVALALLALAVLPGVRVLRTPQDNAERPGGIAQAVHEALTHRGFWLLNLGFLTCGFQLGFIGNHLPAYLLDRGFQLAAAVSALALVALANVAGTYACGVLGAHYSRKHLLAWIYLLRTAAMALFLLLPANNGSLYLFATAMGLLWLGTVPLTSGLLGKIFGARYLATLFGFVFMGHQLGAFLGVWLGGRIFELTRSYDLVWMIAMALGVIAAALHWPIDETPLTDRSRARAVA